MMIMQRTWNTIISVRNILNHNQLSVFHDAQIFLNSETHKAIFFNAQNVLSLYLEKINNIDNNKNKRLFLFS